MGKFPRDIDEHYMHYAIALARRGMGRTSPNPSVGCVIVKNGRVIAAARTSDGGRPHAEANALAQVGADAKGADVYVTLEPCAHHGKTPPCAEALVLSGAARVIIGCGDPDPRVSGKGLEILKLAHINTVDKFVDKDALGVNEPFLTRVTQGRPFVALKTATTSDGKLVPETGGQWITGDLARRKVHQLRSNYESILCGIGTVLADDPLLTTRLPGLKHTVPRIVLDTHLRMPLGSRLVNTALEVPLWVFHQDDPDSKFEALQAAGARLFACDMRAESILQRLAEEGISSVFVEGGGAVYESFLKADLADKLYWFQAPNVRGASDSACFNSCLFGALGHTLKKTISLGEDRLEIFTRKR